MTAEICKESKRPLYHRFVEEPLPNQTISILKLLMAEDIPPEALVSQDSHKIIPPLHGALLKNEQDVHLFERLVFMSRRKPG